MIDAANCLPHSAAGTPADGQAATIVLVGPAPPLRGGIAQFTAQLYHQLRTRHTVHIVSFSRQYPGLLFPGRTQFDDSHSPLLGEGTAVPLLDSISPPSWWRSAAHIARLAPAAVVFMHWMPFFAPAYGTMARRLRARSRVVFLCHNLYPHEPSPVDRLLTRFALRAADAMIVLSESVAQDARELAPHAKICRAAHPVPNIFPAMPSASEARRTLGIDRDELVLLFFGYVRAYKGLAVLLRALPLILQKRRCCLLVAGEFYEPRSHYEHVLRELDIAHAVMIIDRYLRNEEVPPIFAAADLCVLPYVSATQSGVAKLAYGFDKPVLITDVGGLAEEVAEGKTGYVVPPGNSEALAAAVEQFCRDREHHDFAAAIAEFRQRYTWEPLVTTIEELLG